MSSMYSTYGSSELYDSNGELVQGTGWGSRVRSEKPARLEADMPDGTSSIVNRATQELWIRFKYEMIGLDWNDLRAYLIKNCPQYDASQVLYSMKTQGKLLRVYISGDGEKDVQWRDDLVRDRDSYYEKMNIAEAKNYFKQLTEAEIVDGSYEEEAMANLGDRTMTHLNQLVSAAKKRLNTKDEAVEAEEGESRRNQYDALNMDEEE